MLGACQDVGDGHDREEQRLRMCVNRDPTTLDPRKVGDVVSTSLQFLLYEGLTRLNPDHTTSLAQAESMEISENGKLYTFHLRACKWSDGSPITAYDYEQSWKDLLDPDFPAPNAYLLYPIKNAEAVKKGQLPLETVGIKARDPNTLLVELHTPAPYFLELISFATFFPINHAVAKEYPEWACRSNDHFICNGPFKLTRWKHNHQITLEKNPYYWEAAAIKLDAIEISIIDHEMTALHMYERGDLDLLTPPLSPVPLDALSELSQKGMLHINPVAATTNCFFNTTRFPFNNAHLRKAFAYAIHRQAIVDGITQLHEQIATGPIPPVLKANQATSFFRDNDAISARAHLQLGLQEMQIAPADLGVIVYSYPATEANHKIAQVLQQQWQTVLGIEVRLEKLEHKILLEKLTKRDYTMAQSSWIAQYKDPMNILERFKIKDNVKNYSGWEDAAFYALLERSTGEKSPAERLRILLEAERIFVDQMPVSPIFHWNSAALVKPYLQDVHFSPTGALFIEKLSINKRG